MYASRPAREGEIYVTTRFPSGSIGLAAPGDCTTAVCVTYGARLRLENLPSDLQDSFKISGVEDISFTRLEDGLHHDGVKFANGHEAPLHRLGTGVLVSVIEAEKPIRKEQTVAEEAPVEEAQMELEPAE
jgi:hypothetical protein